MMAFASSWDVSRVCKPPPLNCNRNPGTKCTKMQPLKYDTMIREHA